MLDLVRACVLRISDQRRSDRVLMVISSVFLLCTSFSFSQNLESLSILVIHSYESTFDWTRRLQQGIESVLMEADETINIFEERLDAKRLTTVDDWGFFTDYLRVKYTDFDPSLIIVSDGPALSMMLEAGIQIFSDVPILFSGISTAELRIFNIELAGGQVKASNAPVAGGVLENIDVREVLELGLRLWPNRTTVYVLTDETPIGAGNRSVVRTIAPAFDGRLSFEYLVPSSLAEMRRLVSDLPDDAILLFNHFIFTAEDGFMPFEWIIPEIMRNSSVPVLGTHDFMITYGASAGYVTDGFKQGTTVAQQALRVLRGEPVGPIAESPNTTMVREPQLIHFQAQMRTLPLDAVILNRTPGFIEANGRILAITASIIVFLSAIIGLLVFQNNQRRMAVAHAEAINAQLTGALQEKSVLMREVHHRTKNNLQVLESMVALELMGDSSPTIKSSLESLRGRIKAIALVHKKLYKTESIASIDLYEYIEELVTHMQELNNVNNERAKYETETAQIVLDASGASPIVSMDVAVPLGLIVNEAITNSLIHGRNGIAPASVYIGIDQESEGTLKLEVRDNGPGFPTNVDESQGLGVKLMKGLAAQIGGSVDLHSANGAITTMVFPISGVT